MGREAGSRVSVTERVFVRQLAALGAKDFELGIKLEGADTMERRQAQTIAELTKAVGYLKYRNLNGHHIYIRPGVGSPCVLLDDLTVKRLIQIEEDGVCCACVVQTSDFNYQAWVRFDAVSLDPALATCLGEILATRYNADLASKDFRHFGRAAGFTNVKPIHQRVNGLFPFTRLEEATGRVTPNSAELMTEARQLLIKKEAERQERLKALLASEPTADQSNACAEFAEAVAFVFDQYGSNTDPSRADAAAVQHLLIKGYSAGSITGAMLSSADIQSRRPKTYEDYVQRTVQWACGARSVK